jgi:hypothetical protein
MNMFMGQAREAIVRSDFRLEDDKLNNLLNLSSEATAATIDWYYMPEQPKSGCMRNEPSISIFKHFSVQIKRKTE